MSLQIVAQAKADLIAALYDLSGNNGAFLIVMEAASRIPGAGVLDKPSGNHAEFNGQSYAVDIVAFPDGRIVDCLIDGGGANTPSWDTSKAPVDPSRFRPAVKILAGVPPVVVPPPTPSVDLAAVLAKLDAIAADINAHSDANTEKIQQQIDQVVKNAEASVQAALPQILGALGGGGILGGLFGRATTKAPRNKAK